MRCFAVLPGGRLDRAVGQPFQRHAALHQFLLKDVIHCLQLVLVDGVQHDRILAVQFNHRLRILQVEAGMDFLQRLLDGVGNFLQVNLADDVECVLWHGI